jgi:tellurite resistance protein TerC
LGIVFAVLTVTVIASRYFKKKLIFLPKEVEEVVRITIKQGRRIVALIVGITTILIGLAMLVLPGPAIIVIPLGILILATEFRWARQWLKRLSR